MSVQSRNRRNKDFSIPDGGDVSLVMDRESFLWFFLSPSPTSRGSARTLINLVVSLWVRAVLCY